MIEIRINPADPAQMEILLALVTELPVDGIRELDGAFLAYTAQEHFESKEFKDDLENLKSIVPFEYSNELLPDINWNEVWEKHFEPVVVEDFLTIKAGFHNLEPDTRYVVTINPKMSFGTGHHATTWMMVKALSMLNPTEKKVLDAGTGTGILAILAVQLGAGEVFAFDHDEWSYTNALENCSLNGVEDRVRLTEGSLQDIGESDFDLILANINRNYLVAHTTDLAQKLAPGGFLVISGFYEVDSRKLLDPFHQLNLVAQYLIRRDDWASVIFYKTP